MTDDVGRYRFVNLDPGVCVISATAEGFSRAVQRDVWLLARDELSINLQLTVGNAATTTLRSSWHSVASVELTRCDYKSGDAINSLALNFRATANPSPIGVASLSPGVQSDSGGRSRVSY